MDSSDTDRDQSVAERTSTLASELKLPPDAAESAARDHAAAKPTRKPASDDVEVDRIAAAQAQNAADDAKAKHAG